MRFSMIHDVQFPMDGGVIRAYRGLQYGMFGRISLGIALLFCILGVPSLASAQTSPPSAELLPAPPANWRGASVSADTARMLPGHLDFRRYDTPEHCLRALLHVQSHLYRHNEEDTLQFNAAADTFATVAVDTGRFCYTKLNVATVSIDQLGALIRLQLALDADSDARAAEDRLLSMKLPDADRARALYEVGMAYIQARPMRVESAQRIIAQVDSIGKSMNLFRIQLHAALLTQWERRFNVAEMRKEGESILAIAENSSITERGEGLIPIVNGYRSYAAAVSYEEGRAAVRPLTSRITEIIAPIENGEVLSFLQFGLFRPEEIRDQLVGNTMSPLSAKWTINGDSNAQRPLNGRVTVVVQVQQNYEEFGAYSILRRLATKYGSQGLDIVLVTNNLGYSPGSLVQSAEEEVKSMETFFIQFQKIPATIFVQETQFETRSDGMRLPKPTEFQKSYPGFLLVDRNEKIQLIEFAGIKLDAEAEIDAYVKRAVSGDVVGKSVKSSEGTTLQMEK